MIAGTAEGCTVMNPCYSLTCAYCTPPGSVPSYMRFARHALAHIFEAKRREWTGLHAGQIFPLDRRLKNQNRI